LSCLPTSLFVLNNFRQKFIHSFWILSNHTCIGTLWTLGQISSTPGIIRKVVPVPLFSCRVCKRILPFKRKLHFFLINLSSEHQTNGSLVCSQLAFVAGMKSVGFLCCGSTNKSHLTLGTSQSDPRAGNTTYLSNGS
jgi:hypothetical protein